jgi:formate dehydrogenase subunit gamma
VSRPVTTLDKKTQAAIEEIAGRLSARPGPLLEVLHEVQGALGYVPPAAVPVIAKTLNVSRAEVHGVLTFYHHFRDTPPGQHTVRVCRAEACQARAGALTEAHVKQRLHIDYHETTADGRYSLEPVYCLGNCACGPSVMIDDELHGRVTPERFDEILSAGSDA